MAFFSLDKWYLDVVTPEGDAAILYHAQARLGPVRLSYRSVLLGLANTRATTTTATSKAPEPVITPSGCTYATDLASGTWTRRAQPFSTTLYDGPGGAIHWTCTSLPPPSISRSAKHDFTDRATSSSSA